MFVKQFFLYFVCLLKSRNLSGVGQTDSHLIAFIAVAESLLFGDHMISFGVQHMLHSLRGLAEFHELGG